MSTFNKLFRVLEQELSYQEKLLELLAIERAAIVKLDREKVEKLEHVKKRLIAEAVLLEGKRQELVAEIAAEQGVDTTQTPLKLKEIIETCVDHRLASALDKLGDNLRVTAVTVSSMNKDNGVLIQQALGIVASTVSIMRSCTKNDLPSYGQSGKMAVEDANSVTGLSRSA